MSDIPDEILKANAALLSMINVGLSGTCNAGGHAFAVDPNMPPGQMMVIVSPQDWQTISRLSELAKDLYAQHLASKAIAKAASQG